MTEYSFRKPWARVVEPSADPLPDLFVNAELANLSPDALAAAAAVVAASVLPAAGAAVGNLLSNMPYHAVTVFDGISDLLPLLPEHVLNSYAAYWWDALRSDALPMPLLSFLRRYHSADIKAAALSANSLRFSRQSIEDFRAYCAASDYLIPITYNQFYALHNPAVKRAARRNGVYGSYWRYWERETYYTVSLFAGHVKVRQFSPLQFRQSLSTRGTVQGFSKKSRGRMIEKLSGSRKLADNAQHSRAFFITLTYHEEFPTTPDEQYAHLDAFIKRLKRFMPAAAGIWKKEIKVRQSGENVGEYAPHYHLLLMGSKPVRVEWLRQWVAKAWNQIAAPDDIEHLKVHQRKEACSYIESRKHAMFYLTKYMTKDDVEELEWGRRWGSFGDLTCTPSFTVRLTPDQYTRFSAVMADYLASIDELRKRDFLEWSAAYGLGFKIYGAGDGGLPMDCVSFDMLQTVCDYRLHVVGSSVGGLDL